MRIRYSESRLGISLIEVVVTLGIMTVLFGVTLAYNRSSVAKTTLYTEQSKVIGVLNRAKGFALQKYREGGSRFCGFGVVFYVGGSDYSGSGDYELVGVNKPPNDQTPCIAPSSVPPPSDVTPLENYILHDPIAFKSVTPHGGVFFVAPYLETFSAGNVDLEVKGNPSLPPAVIEIGNGGTITAIQ